MRALLLENPHENADAALESAGLEVVRHTGAMDEDELIAALDGVQVLGIRSKTTVTRRVLEAAPDLLTIGAFCIGTNQVDLGTAAHRGVTVFNAPFSNTRSVVELTLGEIIALNRRLTAQDSALHAGRWDKSAAGSHEVRGRTLGIVGYGNIGTQLSVLAEALGMRVVFYDTAEKLALGNARRMGSLEELLEIADVVTLHVDGRAGNAGMFGREQFERMRPGAIFLNLSRGFLVDYAALRERVLSGAIAGAAVDVFPEEPKRNGDPFDSELRGLPNVILTPHVGGSTEEAQEGIGAFVSNKLASYVLDGTTTMSVNVPPLALDRAPTARYRVTYLHRNTPGALALVNQAFAESGANIEGQILGTRGDLGYVVTDIGGELPDEARQALDEVPDTIRLRVLLTGR
ncbi:D-3-phosphoglycerate dehydrogenase [Georgenia satyanarayanai]|uniref:D-3-phosphoglycerate dehydrogenase n=1 Tax=Georgenia satyanarayanai TaxID=860221 RepID=A0A2Y9AH11_9MICO|nr:phosphoglycerate dehydrogenase [Georgenia satyanarayanai]PYF99846.1 D-3-phosphoglycerate dehydrogenase [Georgenia satyanarayanai]SSA41829.1 D-3-phosphoglycerate dehydrogenase [Georgenia satyanarayanai]